MRITGLGIMAGLCVLLLSVPGAVGDSFFGFLAKNETLTFLKRSSGFADWPGRTKTVRNGFKVSPDILPDGFKLLQEDEATPSFNGCILLVNRTYRVAPPRQEQPIQVTVKFAADSFTAQEFILKDYLLVTKTLRPNHFARSRGSAHGLGLGDITLVDAEDEGFSAVQWTRNNIFVRIETRHTEGYAFVGPLARAVDKAIKKRKTFKKYFACSARPKIIPDNEETEMQKKKSFAFSDKAGEMIQARDPKGETLSYRKAEFAGIQIPVVINESNLATLHPRFSWVRRMTQEAVKFNRLYHKWRNAKLSGNGQIVSEKYHQMQKLGIAILPHVIQRGRPLSKTYEKWYKGGVQHFQKTQQTEGGNNATNFPILRRLPHAEKSDLLGLVKKLTDGEVEIKGDTTRKKLLSVTEWWWNNQEKWYRKIADHYKNLSANRK